MTPARGKRTVALLAAGVALVVGLGLLSWKEVVVRYHLGRLRSDPALLVELLERPERSAEGIALRRFIDTEAGGAAFLEAYVARPYRRWQSWRTEYGERNEYGEAFLWLEGDRITVRVETDASDPVGSFHGHPDDPDGRLPPSAIAAVRDLLARLRGRSFQVPSSPGFRYELISAEETGRDPRFKSGNVPGPDDTVIHVRREPAAPAAVLAEMLRSPDPGVRVFAAMDLWAASPEATEAIPDLVQALADAASSAGWVAARALGRMGAPAVPALIEALRSEDCLLKEMAAQALWWVAFHDRGAVKPAVPALIQALEDRDPSGQWAMWIFQVLGPEAAEAVPALTALLTDPYYDRTQYDAAKALLRIGPAARRALPLIEARRKGNPEIEMLLDREDLSGIRGK